MIHGYKDVSSGEVFVSTFNSCAWSVGSNEVTPTNFQGVAARLGYEALRVRKRSFFRSFWASQAHRRDLAVDAWPNFSLCRPLNVCLDLSLPHIDHV